jgi:hypothetical protein
MHGSSIVPSIFSCYPTFHPEYSFFTERSRTRGDEPINVLEILQARMLLGKILLVEVGYQNALLLSKKYQSHSRKKVSQTK